MGGRKKRERGGTIGSILVHPRGSGYGNRIHPAPQFKITVCKNRGGFNNGGVGATLEEGTKNTAWGDI